MTDDEEVGCRLMALTSGGVTKVSAKDLPIVAGFRWGRTKNGYVQSTTSPQTFLHRMIMNPAKGMVVDHANRDKLDNRRENLRVCTKSQNGMNRGPNGGDNKLKGITWCKLSGKWRARIQSNGKRLSIGLYDTAEEAAKAYDCIATKAHGAFARLNFEGGRNDG